MTKLQRTVRRDVTRFVCSIRPGVRIESVRHIYPRAVIAKRRGQFVTLVCEHDAEPQLRGDGWHWHRAQPVSMDTTHKDVILRVGEWVSTAYVRTSDGCGLIYVIPAVR